MSECAFYPYLRGEFERKLIRPDHAMFLAATNWVCQIADFIFDSMEPEQIAEYINKKGYRSDGCLKNEEIVKYVYKK